MTLVSHAIYDLLVRASAKGGLWTVDATVDWNGFYALGLTYGPAL